MNNKKMTIKDSSLSFLFGFLLCQLSVVVITSATLIFCSVLGFDPNKLSTFFNTAIGYIIPSLSLYLAMVLVFLFFNAKKNNKIFKKVKSKKLFFYIGIAIISFLCLYPIITCLDVAFIKMNFKINTLPYKLNTKNYFISLIPLVIAPAICEELLFRGIIFQGLKKHGKVFSIVLSSLMFSIYHMSINQTVYPILMGLLLSVIMYYEENIYYCIAVHMTNNFMSLTLSYFKISLTFNHWLYIVLALILITKFLSIILCLVIKNNKTNEKQPINKTEKIILSISLSVMLLLWIISNFG